MFFEPEIITPPTLELLRQIQQDDFFHDFFLVGGTALALQIGHRLSVDLDFFSIQPFQTEIVVDQLVSKFNFKVGNIARNTVVGSVNDIKVDFITHNYPLVSDLLVEGGITMASCLEIGAMKLNALAHSGERWKDYIDIYYLLEVFSLRMLLNAYTKKYPNSNSLIPLKALVFFEEVDFASDLPILRREVTKERVFERLFAAVQSPEQVF